MSPENALEILKSLDRKLPQRKYEEVYCVGATALRKLIPIQPQKDYMGGEWHYACGACGADMTRKFKFCAECGKAIKWYELF